MAISRLAISNPGSGTDTLIYTGIRTILASIIATNKSGNAGTIKVWVVPLDKDTDQTYWHHVSYEIQIKSYDSLETFRFPVMVGDKVYVRASIPDISFMLSGIDDTNISGVELADLQADIEFATNVALLDI
jgi:hypothetical protein